MVRTGVPTTLVEVGEALDAALEHLDANCGDAEPVVAELIRLEHRVTAAKTDWVGRLMKQRSHAPKGFTSHEDWLAHKEGTSRGEAKKTTTTAKRLRDQPQAREAFAKGDLSPQQAFEVAKGTEAEPLTRIGVPAEPKRTDLTALKKKAARAAAAADPNPAARHRRLHKTTSNPAGAPVEMFPRWYPDVIWSI